MQQTLRPSVAIAIVLLVAACSPTGAPPMTTAERNEVTDDFLSTGPLVSGGIPAADSPTSP